MSDTTVESINQAIGGKLAVLFGGRSAEREISLKSGAAVAAAFASQGVPVETIDIAEDGWMQYLQAEFSNVFIALHGPGGEDGTVQGALDCLGVKYTGSGVMASALAMDKFRCKLLWLGLGLSTPKFIELTAVSDWAAIIADLGAVIVKPACEGSSIGMSRATTAEELQGSWQDAQAYGRVFAEQWVVGSEYTIAILNGVALPAIKLETDAVFYDFNAKYVSDETRYLCPCGLSTQEEFDLSELALAAFNSLGCEGWGRVDVMRDSAGCFYLLEVNTVPGMTDHSLVPMAAKQAGLNFEQLVLAILAGSISDGTAA
ncbi:MAG: D-alanine-D-alanine ligase [Zhongshania sp.]|jgi:D-alanine-D-alanine ligase